MIIDVIAKTVDVVNKTYKDKAGLTKPMQPETAYLVGKKDGTGEHYRYVTDENLIVSKQASGGSGGGGTTGDFIPLTGTEEGKPVTGSLLFQLEDTNEENEPIEIFAGLIIDEEGRAIRLGAGDPVSLSSTIVSSYYNNLELDFSSAGDSDLSLQFSTSGMFMYDRLLNKGLYAEAYYGANYDDNTYVQKKYVDDPEVFIQLLNNADSTQLATIKGLLGIV